MSIEILPDSDPLRPASMVGQASGGEAKPWDRRQPHLPLRGSAGPGIGPWPFILGRLDIALQPIVNIHTGACFGYEALLRNFAESGFASPLELLEAAHRAGRLAEVEMAVREKSIGKFAGLPDHDRAKLFINLDNRLLTTNHTLFAGTKTVLDAYRIGEPAIVFEISERHPLGPPAVVSGIPKQFRDHGFGLAIDDFGTGFSGLQMLYFAEPDFLKIDRFFISDIASNAKKRLFLSQIVTIAHLLGVVVLAEGVETEREYFVCKDVGCDLLQGYFIQRPTTNTAELRSQYETIGRLSLSERRSVSSDHKLISEQVDPVVPIAIDTAMDEVFERFRVERERTFFPVINANGEPLGIVREQELKSYAFSRFGQSLMANKRLGRKLKDFLIRCPMADINTKAEQILQFYSTVDSSEGIIIVDDMKYKGFLSAKSLLRVINDKDLAAAREQNPLSKMPGNNTIHEYVSKALESTETEWILVYFDFDNFKPFNDLYGFRTGDRAIVLFAELIAKLLSRQNRFAGHVGGDDFFVGFHGMPLDSVLRETNRLISQFGREVESFYDEETRHQGWVSGYDRGGEPRRFGLLAVSAAVMHLPAGRAVHSIDEISGGIAKLKKQAKASPERLAIGTTP